MRRVPLPIATIFCLAACSSAGESVTVVQDSRPMADASDASGEEARTRADSGADHSDLVAQPDDWTLDLTPDLPPDNVGPACDPGDGCFLDPCTANDDCLSGWCVGHMGEDVCTLQCQSECPPGWSCQQVPGTAPDVVWVCVSSHANLCLPCATGADCKGAAGADDVCVDYGEEGSFCGGKCSADGDCPWGFSCVETLTVAGIATTQCVADAGVCPCTAKSVELALWTPCARENEFGRCEGQRVCTADGLTGCDADLPAAETCDGVDNDCDGDTDEGEFVDGEYLKLCDDSNPCTDDHCQGADGCAHVALDEGECFDNDPCTIADHCVAGVCVGDPVQCDDENPCTDNVCTQNGGCEYPPVGGDCDDGDPCTLGDHCSDGVCAGEAVSCQCAVDADCAVLEDGNVCNGTLVCDTTSIPTQCVVDPATILTCPEPEGLDAACLAPACDPATGACSFAAANDGKPCHDGDLCTLGDVCGDGECQPGLAALVCDDDNACNGAETCNPETGCAPGLPPVCDDGDLCTDDSCDPAGGCVHKLNTNPCNDNDLCTVNDHCELGQCIGGGPLACNDNNPCTADSCKPASGCQFTPAPGDCDDGSACTLGDTCKNGFCVATSFADCDDSNPCTDDTCDLDAGCVHTPNAAACDDGDACTVGDTCAQGACLPGAEALPCEDGNPCTDDACDPDVGCVIAHNTADCDDGDKCTPFDQCAQGACVGTGSVDCDDKNPCTDDSCDPAVGCVHTANAQPCDDGDLCTVGDGCGDGVCQPGPGLDCDDANECTQDSCDPAQGCVYVDQDCCGNGIVDPGEQCDDGNDNDGDYCNNACEFEGSIFSQYQREGRNVYIFKSNSGAALSTYDNFCPSLGLAWFVPKTTDDARYCITHCYNLDSYHTWIITRNNTSGETWGGFDVGPVINGGGCGGQCSNSGFSGVRKWSSSFCEPEQYGVTKCWDGDHQYDWLVCEGP